MADGDRTTLFVAVAGIAATALVGIAGTAGSWLSARSDRSTERRLAHDQRTYDHRVAVYADAIDFLQSQKDTWDEYAHANDYLVKSLRFRKRIPWEEVPPPRLTTRLRMFGSTEAVEAFRKTQDLEFSLPHVGGCCTEHGEKFVTARTDRNGYPARPPAEFFGPYN